MDDLNCATQGDMEQWQWSSKLTLQYLKEIFPSIPSEFKDSVSLEKLLQGDGDWYHIKEILGWIINMQDDTLRLHTKHLAELNILLAIPPSQRCMSTKKLDLLIGKLRSMHLAIPDDVGNFYHLQMALTAAHHASRATAYLSKDFHRDVKFWQYLCVDTGSRITFSAENIHCLATDVGYANTSGLGCGGVWIDPNQEGVHYVWSLPWPKDIMTDLVSTNNTHGRITNSDIELAALVFQEATFPFISANPSWRAPFTGSDNITTVTWNFWEASTVNPVVADLLCLRSLVNRQFKITQSVFYHPGPKNTMANDASRKFHLAPDIFLFLFSTTYSPQQYSGMWHACHPPSKIFYSVISVLRKQPFEVGMSPVKILPRSIVIGCPSAPKFRWTTCLRIWRTPLSRSFGFLITGSVTDTTPHECPVYGQTRLLLRGMLSPRPTSKKAAGNLGSRLVPTAGT